QYSSSHFLEIDIDGENDPGPIFFANTSASKSPTVPSAEPRAANYMSKDSTTCQVVFVAPAHAKETKEVLLEKGLLDKRFRMIKTATREHVTAVAIPITIPYARVQQEIASTLRILEYGDLAMPYSTSQYARGTQG
ncbi:MAG: hypothetical protein SGILL_008836, partial [Bacillariaceae sp.]